ncbi:MAG: hypothetical protein JSV89_17480 [Spirochaetaceae bacterium]|nr:MAG: hypothetical protein JSV89_17480 [Spirochaetaceae bacterium]
MNASSAAPAFRWQGDDLCVGYRPDGDETYTIVRFHDVTWSYSGYPNDEGLEEHRLQDRGLESYRFHEVVSSDREVDSPNRHYVATFHDITLEVHAARYSVEARSVEATSIDNAMYLILGPIEQRGMKPHFQCFNMGGSKHSGLPVLHSEDQDTTTLAWARVLDNIETARRDGRLRFEPLAGLKRSQRAQIFTLPDTIGSLDAVEEIFLYGSHLVRLPPEIGRMASLKYLDVYTSYTLHFFPYELTRCTKLTSSRVSTRALYGNRKYRPRFPHLKLLENQAGLSKVTPKECSVCGESLVGLKPIRRWITLAVGSDDLPLLVNACSMACIKRLPSPPEGYVQKPYIGGHHVHQTPSYGI